MTSANVTLAKNHINQKVYAALQSAIDPAKLKAALPKGPAEDEHDGRLRALPQLRRPLPSPRSTSPPRACPTRSRASALAILFVMARA
jgi:hypothetical protein